jgi:predicted dinucleotide-binding enzyme
MAGAYNALVAESSTKEETGMATAIIGIGNIGGPLARHLVSGGEPVVLAAKDEANAKVLAQELGEQARAASVEEAIAEADTVVFAVWLDTIKELISKDKDLLGGKVIIDPSNPIGLDENGEMTRTLPNDQSAGSVVAAALPTGAQYVKAFGTLAADSLASGANRKPQRAVLFYATDDAAAAATIERLISAAGFDPLKVGGVDDAARIEVPGGDLHQNGGLNGQLLDLDQARTAVAADPTPAAR